MSNEFKYGDEVVNKDFEDGMRRIYLSPHPNETGDMSVIYNMTSGFFEKWATYKFKLKPKTHIVNGIEVAEPIPVSDIDYEGNVFVVDAVGDDMYIKTSLDEGTGYAFNAVTLGLAFYTKEDVIANIEAMKKRV